MVGLAAVPDYEFSQLARKPCVLSIKIKRFLEELPDIWVRFGNGGGNDLGRLGRVNSGIRIAIGWEPETSPTGYQIGRIPTIGDGLCRDAMRDSHPSPAETVTLLLGVMKRWHQDLFPVFLEPLASDERLPSGWCRLNEVRDLQDFEHFIGA